MKIKKTIISLNFELQLLKEGKKDISHINYNITGERIFTKGEELTKVSISEIINRNEGAKFSREFDRLKYFSAKAELYTFIQLENKRPQIWTSDTFKIQRKSRNVSELINRVFEVLKVEINGYHAE